MYIGLATNLSHSYPVRLSLHMVQRHGFLQRLLRLIFSFLFVSILVLGETKPYFISKVRLLKKNIGLGESTRELWEWLDVAVIWPFWQKNWLVNFVAFPKQRAPKPSLAAVSNQFHPCLWTMSQRFWQRKLLLGSN